MKGGLKRRVVITPGQQQLLLFSAATESQPGMILQVMRKTRKPKTAVLLPLSLPPKLLYNVVEAFAIVA